MFTPYWIAFAPARKPYRIALLFTHKNGDLGAISVTKRSCAEPISRVESHISDSDTVFILYRVGSDSFSSLSDNKEVNYCLLKKTSELV